MPLWWNGTLHKNVQLFSVILHMPDHRLGHTDHIYEFSVVRDVLPFFLHINWCPESLVIVKRTKSVWTTVADPKQYVPCNNAIFPVHGFDTMASGMLWTSFHAYKPDWLKQLEMAQADPLVLVAVERSTSIRLGVIFLFLFDTKDKFWSSWCVVLLPWALACFGKAFSPSVAICNLEITVFDIHTTVATVMIFWPASSSLTTRSTIVYT